MPTNLLHPGIDSDRIASSAEGKLANVGTDPEAEQSLATRWAMCGRLQAVKGFSHGAASVGAAMCSAYSCGSHKAAGHNAFRGSGPGQQLAFDNAVAQVGCPDRRIDQSCITCCLPFPTVLTAPLPALFLSAAAGYLASATGSL